MNSKSLNDNLKKCCEFANAAGLTYYVYLPWNSRTNTCATHWIGYGGRFPPKDVKPGDNYYIITAGNKITMVTTEVIEG